MPSSCQYHDYLSILLLADLTGDFQTLEQFITFQTHPQHSSVGKNILFSFPLNFPASYFCLCTGSSLYSWMQCAGLQSLGLRTPLSLHMVLWVNPNLKPLDHHQFAESFILVFKTSGFNIKPEDLVLRFSTSFTQFPTQRPPYPSLTTPQKTAISPIIFPSLFPTYPAPLQCHLPHIHLNICLFSVDFQ